MNETIKLIKSDKSSSELIERITLHLKSHKKIDTQLLDYKDDTSFEKNELILLLLSDSEIKEFLKKNLDKEPRIGVVPNKNAPRVMRSYGISTDIFEALDDAFDSTRAKPIDLLFCNDEICFNNIVIGNVHGLNESALIHKSLFKKIESFFLNLFNLKFHDYTLVTAKEQSVRTAATGIMILEHSISKLSHNSLSNNLSFHDGKLNALILSPSSIISYIYYLMMSFFYYRFSIDKLPKSIGVISSTALKISSSKPLDFVVDGIGMSAKEIDLRVKEDGLCIQLGRLLKEDALDATEPTDSKETIKISSLPKGEIRQLLINNSVPIFKRAEEEDFKELFISLKQNAQLSSPYVVLMILSTLLATTGLFQNSTPVIIGAMILAPLMSPIVSLSMGVARGEQSLMKESALTLFIGSITALLFSSLYTFLMPLNILTSEMSARLHPNLLDLMVAVISGVAGAYASAKSQIAKSLAGVAIAVALVPPLSVVGIGVGFGDLAMIYGSLLLFITNLVGITLAATLTFLLLGYSPMQRAKKGIYYTSGLLAIVAVPLVLSFLMLVEQNNIIRNIHSLDFSSKNIKVVVSNVDLAHTKPNIYIEVHSKDRLEKESLLVLKKEMESVLGKEIYLDVTPKITLD